jgi:hypothetical protein
MNETMVAREILKIAKRLVGSVDVEIGRGEQFELGECEECGTKTRYWTKPYGRNNISIRLCRECAKTFDPKNIVDPDAHRIRDFD